MTALDFKQKVKKGSKIKNKGVIYECCSVDVEGFMYSFMKENSEEKFIEFAIIGITDGSVAEIELA